MFDPNAIVNTMNQVAQGLNAINGAFQTVAPAVQGVNQVLGSINQTINGPVYGQDMYRPMYVYQQAPIPYPQGPMPYPNAYPMQMTPMGPVPIAQQSTLSMPAGGSRVLSFYNRMIDSVRSLFR